MAAQGLALALAFGQLAAQALEILRRRRQADAHLRDDAVVAAAELSARYLAGRQLPDKAVDVLDTACARVR
ncbi:hypothetical protein LDY98_29685, partial [Pseudomonas aeruginosa]|nr:hypothetical protein [Pseudomonas aeruginosa]